MYIFTILELRCTVLVLYLNSDAKENMKLNLLACNEEGITPLHDAVLNDQVEVVRLLMKHGGRYSSLVDC